MKAKRYLRLEKDIRYEEEQIEKVILKINELKNSSAETDITAQGAYLMNFYNGLENIMKRCAKEYYQRFPQGEDWHKQLLKQSYLGSKIKKPILSKDISDKLYDYLTFRHLFIHGYGFNLKREQMKQLVDGVDALWREIKNSIQKFINEL